VAIDQQAFFDKVRGLVELGGMLVEKGSAEAESNFHASRTMMAALARLYGVSNAVDKEDWDAARNGILELNQSYGRP
jgi:hypothetical protein